MHHMHVTSYIVHVMYTPLYLTHTLYIFIVFYSSLLYSHIYILISHIGMKHLLYVKIEDAGHHSFNQFAVSAPYISSKLGTYLYAYVVVYNTKIM